MNLKGNLRTFAAVLAVFAIGLAGQANFVFYLNEGNSELVSALYALVWTIAFVKFLDWVFFTS